MVFLKKLLDIVAYIVVCVVAVFVICACCYLMYAVGSVVYLSRGQIADWFLTSILLRVALIFLVVVWSFERVGCSKEK